MNTHYPLFITGTDTEIGKTWCTLALIKALQQQGLSVAGMKPIATGCHVHAGALHNEDAEKILAAASVHVPYEWVNPYSFVPPISPHLAAAQTSTCISIEPIVKAYQQLAELTDIVVIEGVGGWRVPINAQQGLREIVQSLQARVILVVGLRLGCINHALLSAETILRDGCQLVGWIANEVDPYFEVKDSVASIRERLAAPLLAHIPYMAGEMELQGNLIERVKR